MFCIFIFTSYRSKANLLLDFVKSSIVLSVPTAILDTINKTLKTKTFNLFFKYLINKISNVLIFF